MEFEPVIGIEIHVEMKTKSKMFSSAEVAFGREPNTLIAPLDMAFPGTMPKVNRQAVKYAIRVCHALHMEIDHELWFDRKNYFYSDLPKGFQITQDKRPIGKNGYVTIETSAGKRQIAIERLHMEEDTAKQIHLADFSMLDYNRAGTPLVEIVSRPDIRSGEEAMKYVEQIRSIVQYADVSDGKMEEGSLRCDVNVSIRPKGEEKLGTKVEIKNLNSLANVQKAIDYEVSRQQQLLLSNEQVEQETRRFDETEKKTVLMRKKTDAADYKYFTEPNIVPIRLSDEFVRQAIEECPELAYVKKERYLQQFHLSSYDADLLLNNKEVASYFDEAVKTCRSPKLLCNYLMVDYNAILKKQELEISKAKLSPAHLSELMNLIEEGKLSSKQAKEVLAVIAESDESPEEVATRMHLIQVSDVSFLEEVIASVLEENPQSIVDYRNGKSRALGFLVGQVMKKSKGKANPSLTSEMLLKRLNEKE